MAEMLLSKLPNGALMPADEETAEALRKIKTGVIVRADVKQVRNYKFLQKYMVLVRFLYGIWEETAPRMQYRGQEVKPNLARFRGDLQILAGHYTATYNIRGEVRLEPKSVSFASMAEEEFEQLFSSVIDVALSKVLNRPDLTEEKIREHCENVLNFS